MREIVAGKEEKYLAFLESGEICELRTYEMLRQAEISALGGMSGVIKAGEQHYKEAEPLKKDLKLNLVSQKDFDPAVQLWKKREKLKENQNLKLADELPFNAIDK